MITAVLLLGGCATPSPYSGSPKAKEFRKQIAQSAPVMEWGYTVQQLRFTADQRKALVIFAKPGGGTVEVILEDDGFSRYRGAIWNEDLSEAYSREGGLKREVEALMAGTGRERKESPSNRMENARPPENSKTPLRRLSDSHKTVVVTIPKARPTCPHATKVREELANSEVVKEWGYKAQELVFSDDCRKVLVLCLDTQTGKPREIILEDDGFRRFVGTAWRYNSDNQMEAGNQVRVLVTLP